jgi:hypothetical protein
LIIPAPGSKKRVIFDQTASGVKFREAARLAHSTRVGVVQELGATLRQH